MQNVLAEAVEWLSQDVEKRDVMVQVRAEAMMALENCVHWKVYEGVGQGNMDCHAD